MIGKVRTSVRKELVLNRGEKEKDLFRGVSSLMVWPGRKNGAAKCESASNGWMEAFGGLQKRMDASIRRLQE